MLWPEHQNTNWSAAVKRWILRYPSLFSVGWELKNTNPTRTFPKALWPRALPFSEPLSMLLMSIHISPTVKVHAKHKECKEDAPSLCATPVQEQRITAFPLGKKKTKEKNSTHVSSIHRTLRAAAGQIASKSSTTVYKKWIPQQNYTAAPRQAVYVTHRQC